MSCLHKVNNTKRRIHGSFSAFVFTFFLIAIGLARIGETYRHVSQVYDEPFHILRGMHWQSGHVYVHSEHPPLGPLVFAIIPRWSGVGYTDSGRKLEDGNSILYGNGDYLNTLMRFRLGNLFFFCLACLTLHAWSACNGRPWRGTLSVLFFTLCPPVLAHSGLATTDMPITTMLLCAVFAIERAVRQPSWNGWMVAGLASGLAFVSKLSALLFIPVSLTVLLCFAGGLPSRPRSIFIHAFLYCFSCFAVIWSIYGFTVDQLHSIRIAEYAFDGFPSWAQKLYIPAPEYISGVIWAKGKIDAGHGDYFFGNVVPGGSPLFFPVVLAIKTPLAMVVSCIMGAVVAIAAIRRGFDWIIVPTVISLSLLLCVFTSSVNIGLRHILPIYPYLSVVAAHGIFVIYGLVRGHIFRRILAIGFILVLTSWLLLDSCRSHPHYISHFNELAFGAPERIVINSDLDWGQGVFELVRTCQELDVQRLQVHYFGTARLREHGLPSEPSTDDKSYWVAISVTSLYRDPRFEYFRSRLPDAIVRGGSIRLYHQRE